MEYGARRKTKTKMYTALFSAIYSTEAEQDFRDDKGLILYQM